MMTWALRPHGVRTRGKKDPALEVAREGRWHSPITLAGEELPIAVDPNAHAAFGVSKMPY